MLGLLVFIYPARFVSFSLPLCLFFPLLHIGGSVGGLLVRESERNGEKSDRSKGLRGEEVKIRTEEVTTQRGVNGNEALKINEKRQEKKIQR